jgi:hypothetical protein
MVKDILSAPPLAMEYFPPSDPTGGSGSSSQNLPNPSSSQPQAEPSGSTINHPTEAQSDTDSELGFDQTAEVDSDVSMVVDVSCASNGGEHHSISGSY